MTCKQCLFALASMIPAGFFSHGMGVDKQDERGIPPPMKEISQSPEGCQIERFTLPSPSMGREISVVVVLPPAYEDGGDARFPVLYTLHGMGAPYDTFRQMSHLRKALQEMPMIVVSFDGDRAGWFLDSAVRPESQFRTFYFDELVPWIEGHYRTTRERAVTGFSMGGYGAMFYTLSKPDFFASVSSLSGAFRRYSKPDAMEQIQQSLEDLLGPYAEAPERFKAQDPYWLLEELVAAGKRPPPIMLRCGIQDWLIPSNREFVDFIGKQNKIIRERVEAEHTAITDPRILRERVGEKLIDFQYVETNGAHDWPYWLSQSRALIEFHWRHFSR